MIDLIPFDWAGKIFRSPMPFSDKDRDETVFRAYKENGVSVVVQLTWDDECRDYTGKDLRQFYQRQGLQVIYMPLVDFSVPYDLEAWKDALEQTQQAAEGGKNVAVHCYAGIGRTGMFLACLAKKVKGFNGQQAIDWVRSYVPHSVEAPAQIQFVKDFEI